MSTKRNVYPVLLIRRGAFCRHCAYLLRRLRNWIVLPGMILGFVTFFWSSRRVSKRVEAVTQKADQEMAKAQAVSQRAALSAGDHDQAIDASVTILKTRLVFKNGSSALAQC